MLLDPHLAPGEANHRPLTPIDFLDRARGAFPDRRAVIWRDLSWSYRELDDAVRRLMGFLAGRGVGEGSVVSVICGNRPEMLAAHYAVPALGAVLNSINTRLDAETVGWILGHSGSRMLLADPDCIDVATEAASAAGVPLEVFAEPGAAEGRLAPFDAAVPVPEGPPLADGVADEWQAIGLNYTSGTTGRPKGAVITHRGAYLNATGNVMALGLDRRSAYLWTLPMFHCNGWCHTWAVTAAGGVHVCLDRVDPALIFPAIAEHGVTHMSCAPVVLYMMLNHEARALRDPTARLTVATGGAAPTSALIAEMDALGFDFLHLYGLTECYGPVSLNQLDDNQAALPVEDRARLLARQGVRHVTANRIRVLDETGREVPPDGETVGEIVLRGNTLMAGYLHDPEASRAAFAGGHFHTGDLAVVHADGAIEIRDRAKDVIISGGENISSIEVESVLHRHPSVLLAAVVAAPDPKWGEVPCAFIEPRPGAEIDFEALTAFCRDHLAHFKIPRRFVLGTLPKTATGKIQKFQLREQARQPAEA